MSSEQRIQDLRKDADRWRRMVQQFLRYYADQLPERHLSFLDSLSKKEWLQELSYRQGEWLIDIERDVTMTDSYKGYSMKMLIPVCHQNRFDYDDEDRLWIEAVFHSGLTELRFHEARRVCHLAKQIGEVDDWAA